MGGDRDGRGTGRSGCPGRGLNRSILLWRFCARNARDHEALARVTSGHTDCRLASGPTALGARTGEIESPEWSGDYREWN